MSAVWSLKSRSLSLAPVRMFGNLALVAGSLLFAIALAEAVLTVIVPAPIEWKDPQELYFPDPLLGHRLVPGQESFTHSFPVATNSHGFRDREYSFVPPPGVVRILCLGDSLTFGDGVPVTATYPKQLESLLNVTGGSGYEVINTGVPSYDTWQEVDFFKERGISFKPKIVILGFYANDVVPRPPAVKTALAGGGTLRRKGFGAYVPDQLVHVLKGSRVLLVLKDRIGKLTSAFWPSSEYVHEANLLEGLPDEFVERGWREVESSLSSMARLQRDHGFRFYIVLFPMAEQLVHEHPRSQYPARVKQIADKLDVPFLDLTPVFKQRFAGFGSLFIEWDGHPNPAAHRLAAEEIVRVWGASFRSQGGG